MGDIENIVALIVALATAIYLAYDKISLSQSSRSTADEATDLAQAEALAKTAETSSFFMETARSQVEQNCTEIANLRTELYALRDEITTMSREVAALRAENVILRELNTWFRTYVLTIGGHPPPLDMTPEV